MALERFYQPSEDPKVWNWTYYRQVDDILGAISRAHGRTEEYQRTHSDDCDGLCGAMLVRLTVAF
jgi:hypothetical protein